VEEVRYERVLPTYNAADVKTSTEFNFVIPPSSEYFTRYETFCIDSLSVWIMFFFCFSFSSDYQMVIDAQVVLTVKLAEVETQELLHPPRHQITLPLSGMNFIFEEPEVAYNQTTKSTSDK
jgi:hypothetical protein